MKPTMTKAQFEALSSRLLGALPGINDARSLLAAVQRVLEPQLAVLIRRDGHVANGWRVIATIPLGDLDWASDNLKELRSWCSAESPLTNAPGYTKESALNIGERKFSDALVALGLQATSGLHEHELLAFHRDVTLFYYSSYHCIAAAVLLRNFEHLDTTRLMEREKTRRERYARSLTQNILPIEPWEDWIERIAEPGQTLEPSFIGPSMVQWTAYRCRPDQATGITDSKPIAYEWLKERSDSAELADYFLAAEYLLGRWTLDSKLIKGLSRLIKAGNEPRKAVTMVVEIAWRRIATEAESGARSALITAEPGFADLLNLTSTLAVKALAAHGENSSTSGRTELGRATLRVYFCHLVADAGNLRRRYLWIDGGYEHRLVPNSVRAEYLLNLARYLLGVLEILEKWWGINVGDGVVPQLGFLDSLLYLIDRFVHVELDVEECLHVRERLTQGFASEVHHHMLHPFYRDHLVHVIDVFLLGYLLLNARLKWIGREEKILVEHLVHLDSTKEGPVQVGDWKRQWAVASLLHDIGYQLVRTPSSEKVDTAFRHFFSALGGSALPGPDDETKAAFLERLRDAVTGGRNDETWWLPISAIDPMDHGILSSLRVAQLLQEASRSQGEGVEQKKNPSSLASRYSHALHAMANHNLPGKRVQLSEQPLACLLRICDELQEWGRPRVHIEKFVKHLYLTLEGGESIKLETREIIQRVEGNLCFRCEGDLDADLQISVTGSEPRLLFSLFYHKAVDAHFDATATFLSKSYNLQYVELVKEGLECRIELIFSRPHEYGSLSEHDIYGLYVLRSRELPELWTYQNLSEAMPGLCRIESLETGLEDRIGIVIMGVAGEANRIGWQRVDPDKIRSKFILFKKQLLSSGA